MAKEFLGPHLNQILRVCNCHKLSKGNVTVTVTRRAHYMTSDYRRRT